MEPSSESSWQVFSDTLMSWIDNPPWASAPVIPAGMLPAVVWSTSKRLWHLRHAGDRLVWLAQRSGERTEIWSVQVDEIERVAPVQIATFAVCVTDCETEAGEVEAPTDSFLPSTAAVVNETLYLEHPEGVAQVSLGDGALTTIIPLEHPAAKDGKLVVRHLAAFEGRVFCLGIMRVAPDRSATWLVQVAPGEPTTLWESAVVDIEGASDLVVGIGQLWFLCDGVPHTYGDGRVTALRSRGLHKLLAADGDLFAFDSEHLIALDPKTGLLRHVLLPKCPGEVQSMIRTGDWICLAGWDGQHSTILAVRIDGSEARCVVRIDCTADDLCSDGRYLYWVCSVGTGGCVCRTPLGGDGAPLPVVASPPEVVLPRRAAPVEPLGRATIRGGRGLPAPALMDSATHGLAYQSLVAALDSTVAVPEADRDLLVPWCGWLFLALARYRAAQLEVLRGLPGGTIPRPKGAECCWMWMDAELTWSSREQHAMVFRIQEVGDGIHAMIDPNWINEWDFTGYIEQRRERCPIAAQLWRWLPGRALIAKLAGWRVRQFGGDEDSSGGMPMLRLPELLEEVAYGPLALASIAEEDLPRVAYWLGDAEIGCPADVSWCERQKQQHRRMIDELIDVGEYSVLHALPELRPGAELTEACDYLLAGCAVTDTFALDAIVTLLRKHLEAPPSRVLRRVLAEVTPMGDLGRFASALPYLCERGIELETARAKLRMLTGLGPTLLGEPAWSPNVEAMLAALVLEPEAGRRILASSLRHESSSIVENAASLLVTIAAPWCVAMIQNAQGSSPHQEVLDAALGWLGLGITSTSSVHSAPRFASMVSWARTCVNELHEMERSALRLHSGGN